MGLRVCGEGKVIEIFEISEDGCGAVFDLKSWFCFVGGGC
jgi:hypothetical protein